MKNAVAVIILSLIFTMLHEKTGSVIPHYKGLKNIDKYSIKKVLSLLSPELLYFEVSMVAEKLMSNEQISNDSKHPCNLLPFSKL